MGTNYGQLHPSQVELLSFFDYEHLPEGPLRRTSAMFGEMALDLRDEVQDGVLSGPEVTVALRKLLEAKDCAVRAALVAQREGGE